MLSFSQFAKLLRFSWKNVCSQNHLPEAFIVHIYINEPLRCITAIFLAESMLTLLF